MVSMKNIADALNLSRCTVSNILNNKLEGKSYKKETIEMVLDKAKEMGYITNNIAKSLKTGSTRTIALVVPDISNAFYIRIIKETEILAYAADYSLIVCIAEELLEKEEKILEMLASRMVDGVLISPVSSTHSLQRDYPFKIVCFDRTVTNNAFSSVLIDNEAASEQLILKMLEKDIKNPLFLLTSKDDYTVKCRLNAALKTLRSNHIETGPSNIIYDVYDSEKSYQKLKVLLDGQYTQFDSIVLSTNFCIYGVLKILEERKMSMKAIGGFENFEGSDFIGKEVIKVLQPEKEIAAHAFHALLELLENNTPTSIVLDTILN